MVSPVNNPNGVSFYAPFTLVNGSSILALFRQSKIHPSMGQELSSRGTLPRSRSLQAVAVILEGDQLGVMDQTVDPGRGPELAEDLEAAHEHVVGLPGGHHTGAHKAGKAAQAHNPQLGRLATAEEYGHIRLPQVELRARRALVRALAGVGRDEQQPQLGHPVPHHSYRALPANALGDYRRRHGRELL
jgi:hypothetical protein